MNLLWFKRLIKFYPILYQCWDLFLSFIVYGAFKYTYSILHPLIFLVSAVFPYMCMRALNSKWGDRGGVVIWWKIFLHVFLRATSGKFLFQNLTPFEKFRSIGNEEARPGGCNMNMRRQHFSRKPYRLHQICSKWHIALWCRSAHNSYTDDPTPQATASFNLGRKMF